MIKQLEHSLSVSIDFDVRIGRITYNVNCRAEERVEHFGFEKPAKTRYSVETRCQILLKKQNKKKLNTTNKVHDI